MVVTQEIDGVIYRSLSHWGLHAVYSEARPLRQLDAYRPKKEFIRFRDWA